MSQPRDVVALAYGDREGIVETTHFGALVVCAADGRLLASAGNPRSIQYWRSASKPIQALSVITSGAADRFELTERELAQCCASHSGSAMHIETVLGILDKLGMDESYLQCGVHPPGDATERARLASAGEKPGPRHNNCSGKHAGMLASCLALGADPATYLELTHPVQRLITEHLCLMSNAREADLHFGHDGCGAPTAAQTLQAQALAWARLARPDGLPDDLAAAVERIAAAMYVAPELLSSVGSYSARLIEAGGGDIICKGGAAGLFCMAVRSQGLGIAFKIADGSGEAHAVIALATLARLGIDLPDELTHELAQSPITNCHGRVVGHLQPADFRLEMMA
jgi:L-asparaginase II